MNVTKQCIKAVIVVKKLHVKGIVRCSANQHVPCQQANCKHDEALKYNAPFKSLYADDLHTGFSARSRDTAGSLTCLNKSLGVATGWAPVEMDD